MLLVINIVLLDDFGDHFKFYKSMILQFINYCAWIVNNFHSEFVCVFALNNSKVIFKVYKLTVIFSF